jgi:hypothetical protein
VLPVALLTLAVVVSPVAVVVPPVTILPHAVILPPVTVVHRRAALSCHPSPCPAESCVQ